MSTANPTPPPPMRHDLYFMIPDAGGHAVLLLPAPGGWALPQAGGAQVDPWDPGAVAAHLRASLGATVTVLRVAQAQLDREVPRRAVFVYALENHDPAWAPPAGARWAGAADSAARALEPAEAREAVATWLAEETTRAVPTARAPWARRGWLATTGAWMAATLAARNRPLTGPIVQVKTWSISCVLRAETAAGRVYCKATPPLPLFTHEPAVTAALGHAYPDWVPQPLAVEPTARLMLLADFGGPILAQADLPAWAAVMTRFAALQRTCASQVDALLAAGCLDRRLPRLAAGIDGLVAAGVAGAADAATPRLRAEEWADLAAGAARLRDLCATLAGSGIPDTLVHGDLHAGNIAVPGGAPLFFDWSDACIGHPFLDLATLLDPDWLEARVAQAAGWRERYLAVWADLAPLPRLRATADLAMLLGCLHQAVSYLHIVQSIEPAARWELAGGVTFWVRRLLAGLAARPA